MTAPPNSRFTLHPSPVGEVLIVTTDEGVVTLHPLRDRLENELERLSRVLRSIPDRADDDAVAADAAQQLDEYFAGERQDFDLPLDWRLVRGFTRDASRPSVASLTARRPATARSPRTRAVRARRAQSERRARRHPSPSSCRCIGWCGQTVPSASTAGTPKTRCSCWISNGPRASRPLAPCGPGAVVPRARTSCGASGSSPSPPRSRRAIARPSRPQGPCSRAFRRRPSRATRGRTRWGSTGCRGCSAARSPLPRS